MLSNDAEHGEHNRKTMDGWLREWAPRSIAAGRAMQPIWSQPGEKVVRFEESMERARNRFDERLTELNLDGKDLA